MIDQLIERIKARVYAGTTLGNMNDKTVMLLMDCKQQLEADKIAFQWVMANEYNEAAAIQTTAYYIAKKALTQKE